MPLHADAEAAPGFSIASMMPSGAVAETTNPGATSFDGLMMAAVDGDVAARIRDRPRQRARRVPGRDGDVVRDPRRASVEPVRKRAGSRSLGMS